MRSGDVSRERIIVFELQCIRILGASRRKHLFLKRPEIPSPGIVGDPPSEAPIGAKEVRVGAIFWLASAPHAVVGTSSALSITGNSASDRVGADFSLKPVLIRTTHSSDVAANPRPSVSRIGRRNCMPTAGLGKPHARRTTAFLLGHDLSALAHLKTGRPDFNRATLDLNDLAGVKVKISQHDGGFENQPRRSNLFSHRFHRRLDHALGFKPQHDSSLRR